MRFDMSNIVTEQFVATLAAAGMKEIFSIALAAALSLGIAPAYAPTAGLASDSHSATRVAQVAAHSTQQIVVTVDGRAFEVSLYDNPAAEALLKRLPPTIRLSRWGDGEYYGGIAVKILADGKRPVFFDRGELAFGPPGNALRIFFDRTPVRSGDDPRTDSPCLPLGRIVKGDVNAFRAMSDSVTATLHPEVLKQPQSEVVAKTFSFGADASPFEDGT
jgi:hypothetical protein